MSAPGRFHELPEFSLDRMQAELDAGLREELMARRDRLRHQLRPKALANLHLAQATIDDLDVVIQRLEFLLASEGGAA